MNVAPMDPSPPADPPRDRPADRTRDGEPKFRDLLEPQADESTSTERPEPPRRSEKGPSRDDRAEDPSASREEGDDREDAATEGESPRRTAAELLVALPHPSGERERVGIPTDAADAPAAETGVRRTAGADARETRDAGNPSLPRSNVGARPDVHAPRGDLPDPQAREVSDRPAPESAPSASPRAPRSEKAVDPSAETQVRPDRPDRGEARSEPAAPAIAEALARAAKAQSRSREAAAPETLRTEPGGRPSARRDGHARRLGDAEPRGRERPERPVPTAPRSGGNGEGPVQEPRAAADGADGTRSATAAALRRALGEGSAPSSNGSADSPAAASAPSQGPRPVAAPTTGVGHAGRAAPAPSLEHILSQVRLHVRPGVHDLRIQLDPPELGQMHLRFLLRGDQLHLLVRVRHAEVGRVLESDLAQFDRTLRERGLEVASIEVDVEDPSRHGAEEGTRRGGTHASGFPEPPAGGRVEGGRTANAHRYERALHDGALDVLV